MSIGRNLYLAMHRTWRGAFDLFLPSLCPACQSQDAPEGLCDECGKLLLRLAVLPYCHRCGSTLPSQADQYESCRSCPPTLGRFERVVRVGPYAQPLRALIKNLKYYRQESLRDNLAAMLAAAVRARCDRKLDLALSVPMHWRRRLSRGYDHAAILARPLAQMLALPIGDELLRLKHTPPQAHLSRTRRLQNVRGAFAVSHARTIEGASILLVDDVTTTGATADEASRVLLNAGAASVSLAVIAKSEPPAAYSEARSGSA